MLGDKILFKIFVFFNIIRCINLRLKNHNSFLDWDSGNIYCKYGNDGTSRLCQTTEEKAEGKGAVRE
jgi:hypothetical protein